MRVFQMSYERQMLVKYQMPSRDQVEQALLISLFKNNGVVRDFSSGKQVVEEVADELNLDERQRTAYLKTIYKKEGRVKRAFLWHRLLYRAADSLARQGLVSRPSQTCRLTNRQEWMLMEKGYDKALDLAKIPLTQKDSLPIKSYEVQKIVKRISEEERPQDYSPFQIQKKSNRITKQMLLRKRGFRQAVIEAYDYKCAVCGMKLFAPKTCQWEVEAAHIVPHCLMGRDDIFNGLALCRLHHWAFDVGWFTINDNYDIVGSGGIEELPSEFGTINNYEFIRHLKKNVKIFLPSSERIFPHITALRWHRTNVFTG